MALLCEPRSRGLSTFPVGMLVTYQTNTGLASLVAVTEGEGLVGVWCCGCTVLPPLSFFILRVDSKEEAALFMVCLQVAWSSASVDHSRGLMWQAPSERLLSESLLGIWYPSVLEARREFTIQDNLGQVMVFHPGNMPCPA